MNNNTINLVELEKELTQQLENNQIYKQLQAVKLLIQARGINYSSSGSGDSFSTPRVYPHTVQLRTTLEERDKIVNTVINHFKETNNNPLELRELYYKVLASKGITIDSIKPITTLAAILGGRKNVLKKDDMKRWSLVNF